MTKFTDEDGVDGPFERAMRKAEREDAKRKPTKTTHTPGPWTWGEEGKSIYAEINGVERRIATVSTIRVDETTRGSTAAEVEQRIANARIIEAAPGLLAAAERAEQLLASITSIASDLVEFQNAALCELRAAIATARGE